MRPVRLALYLFLVVASYDTTTRAQQADLVVQTGHSGDINSVAFSPDGKTLASGSGDKAVILWDVTIGRELRTLAGHTDWVISVAFSPDGKIVASGSRDQTIKLWDSASGRELGTLTDHAGSVNSIAFSPDGKTLASSSSDRTIRLWDVASGRKLLSLKGHFTLVGSVAFSPDGKTLACGSEDQINPSDTFSINPEKIKLWDVATGRELRSLTGHSDFVFSVAFSPDGTMLTSGSYDKTIKLWDVASGTELRSLAGHSGPVTSVAFSSDGKLVVSGGEDATIRLWSAADGREMRSLNGHSGSVKSVVFSPDGRTLASASPGKINLWDLSGTREVRSLTRHLAAITSVAFSPDGTTVASGSYDNTIKLWGVSLGADLRSLTGHSNRVASLVFSPDGKLLASSCLDNTIKLWDVANATELRSLVWHSSLNDSLAFSPDGKTLASSGSWDNIIKLWEVASGKELRSLTGGSGVFSVAFSPDGKTLASSSGDKIIKLWEVASGRELRSLMGHSSSVLTAAFSPDGTKLVSGSYDKTIKLWDVASGTELRSLTGHSGPVTSVAFSPDGKMVVSGSEDAIIRLWSIGDGKEMRSLSRHSGPVTSVAFSPDGRTVVSAGKNDYLKLSSVADGTELASLVALDEKDWAVLTPDGLFDASVNAWTQLIWRLDNNTFKFAPLEAFFKEFYYPGLLQEIMAGRKPRPPARNLLEIDIRQPHVTIAPVTERAVINPAMAQTRPVSDGLAKRSIEIAVEISDNVTAPSRASHPATSGARDVRLFRNGSLVRSWQGDAFKLSRNDGCQQHEPGKVICEATVPIIAGANDFTAYAFNHDNVKSGDATLTVIGAESLKRTGALYVLAVGVGQYENSQYNLNYTAADARAFGAEVKRQQDKLGRYGPVELISLFDQRATKAAILAVLQKLAETAQPEDGVIVYFSGHGTAQGDRFYLIPHDIGYSGPRKELSTEGLQTILAHSISDVELEAAFRMLDARELVLVIDSCNSGKALQADDWRRGPMNTKGLGQLAYEKGMYILTASQDVELAYESEALRHSYLTYALVEQGLKTAAADKGPTDGQVTLREWFGYAMQAVPNLRQQKVEQDAKKQGKVLEEVEERGRVQQPRAFYRREPEARTFVVARVEVPK